MDPLDDGEAIEARIAARTAAAAGRRATVAGQALARAQALLAASAGARPGLAALREAWVVYGYGAEIRDGFTTPQTGAERVGDHGHADAGPRTPGQLERARAAVALYEAHLEHRPPGWPTSGAGALCALAAQRRAETVEGDIARLHRLAGDMRATARRDDPGRLERMRRRAQGRVAAVAQAACGPIAFRGVDGPTLETAEQRRQRVRDELLLAGHDPGQWPNAALAIEFVGSPATAEPELVGRDPHERLDGAAARADRYTDERRLGLWTVPSELTRSRL